MKFKKSFMIICLIICLFSIASAAAVDMDDSISDGISDSISDGDISVDDEQLTKDANSILSSSDDDSNTSSDETNSTSTDDNSTASTDEDNGTFTSLQNKIDAASEGDTITLDRDYTYDEGFSTRGIQIKKDITIDGNGHSLNGLNQSRILLIHFGLIENTKVVLKNIKFLNGNTDLYGGAIFNYGNLTIKNCTFKNNYAKYCGGAINSVGSLSVKNSYFKSNTAGGDAGAIFSFKIDLSVKLFKDFYKNITPDGSMGFLSTLENIFNVSLGYGTDYIKNCSFISNVANGRGGGAVYAFTNIYINGSTFKNNKAGEHGGAVFANKNLILKNSKFTGNQAPKYGGAVYFRCHEQSGSYVNGSWVSEMKYYNGTVSNSKFTKNTAAKGGAVFGFLYSSSDKKYLKVKKCNFTDNKADSGRDTFGAKCSNCVYFYVKITAKAVTVKKSAKSFVLKATITNGTKKLKAKKVTFKFYGKTYTAKTNSKGIAKVTVKKAVIKKLKAGKTYTVKISSLKKTKKTSVKVKK